MKYEIDQSGKIEKTNKITVVAIANGETYSISISSKDKKILQGIFKKTGTLKMFMIQTFSVLVFLCIRHVWDTNAYILIDKEYPGYESLIKNYVMQLSRKASLRMDKESIRFGLIGKKSTAHSVANKGFKTKRNNYKVNYEEVLALILKLEK